MCDMTNYPGVQVLQDFVLLHGSLYGDGQMLNILIPASVVMSMHVAVVSAVMPRLMLGLTNAFLSLKRLIT